jgi:hypothetical protein
MDGREFFRGFFPIRTLKEIREELFFLSYNMQGGITWSEIEELDATELDWLVWRLIDQIKRERKALER